MESLSGYLALFRMGIKDRLAYKADYVIWLLFRIARPLIMLMIWTAIYLNTSATTIGGFTLAATSAYFFFSMPVTVAISESVSEIMQDDAQSGSVASARVRPMSYPLNVLFSSLSLEAVDTVLLVLPLLALTFFAFHLVPTIASLSLFLVEVVIGLAIVYLIGFFVGTTAIYLTNIYGLIATYSIMVWLLSGAMMPLSFFPLYAQQLLALSPFPIMCYLPIATLLGTAGSAQIAGGILVSLAWVAVLSALAYFWWKRISRDMGSAGG
jgi:ABC-2 type transport system permease protein